MKRLKIELEFKNKGVTLVELLVVLGLMGAGTLILSAYLIQVMRQSRTQQAGVEAAQMVQVATNAFSDAARCKNILAPQTLFLGTPPTHPIPVGDFAQGADIKALGIPKSGGGVTPLFETQSKTQVQEFKLTQVISYLGLRYYTPDPWTVEPVYGYALRFTLQSAPRNTQTPSGTPSPVPQRTTLDLVAYIDSAGVVRTCDCSECSPTSGPSPTPVPSPSPPPPPPPGTSCYEQGMATPQRCGSACAESDPSDSNTLYGLASEQNTPDCPTPNTCYVVACMRMGSGWECCQ